MRQNPLNKIDLPSNRQLLYESWKAPKVSGLFLFLIIRLDAMKPLYFLFLLIPLAGKSQGIIGKWATIDDHSGKQRSVVEIFEKHGKIYGKIVKIFPDPGKDPDPLCDDCPEDDERHNKKIIGMEIIREMEKTGDSWAEGNILDPEAGKIYRCKLWIEDNDLKVRGYWGPFFRTQTWKRIQ